MQPYPRKQVVILMILSIAHTLLFLILGNLIDRFPMDSSHISAQALSILEVVGALLSVYTLTRPWVLPQRYLKRVAARFPGSDVSNRQLNGLLVLFVYVPLVAPCLYGIVLMFWGMSLTYFYFFAGASIFTALVWGVYNLSKSQ